MICLSALLMFIVGAGPTSVTVQEQSVSQADAKADFDALWRDVSENYAYFDSKRTDWPSVPRIYKSELERVTTRVELISLFERVLDELYDAHAQLTVNTANSPRLVPSGADIWAEWRRGQAVVTEVRRGSDAERFGIRAGAEILTLNGTPIATVVRDRVGRSLRGVDDEARSWALRAALAGRHNQERRIGFRARSVTAVAVLPARDQDTSIRELLSVRRLPGNIGFIRLNNSLGDSGLISDFDRVIDKLRDTRGLILDLRDTPSGGNTSVARAILGRFVRAEKPYQKHVLPSEQRDTGVRRSWLELVSPRGRFAYRQPVAVLVDHWTGSMGEGLAIGFDATGAAAIVGTPMARLLGATYHFELPSSHFGVNIPAEKLYHVNGTPREAFEPGITIRPGEQSGHGDDPWIRKALKILATSKLLTRKHRGNASMRLQANQPK